MTRSTVYCTNCSGEFIAELDLSLNGNHEITCPLCRHIHYRVVRDGEVTEDRWRSSAGPTYVAFTSTSITVSTTVNTTQFINATSSILTSAWLSRSDLNLT